MNLTRLPLELEGAATFAVFVGKGLQQLARDADELIRSEELARHEGPHMEHCLVDDACIPTLAILKSRE